MNKKHLGYLIIAALFIILFINLRLRFVYEQANTEVFEVIPTSSDKGFTLKSLQRNTAAEKGKEAKIIISLKPGDTYEGTLLVKNYNESEDEFQFKYFGELSKYDTTNENLEKEVSINVMTPDLFYLDAREWRVIPYTIYAGKELEKNRAYSGIVGVGTTALIQNDNTNIALLVGVETDVEVTDTPKAYEYNVLMENVTPDELIAKYILREGERILAGIFAVIAIYFMYMAFKKKE